MLEDPMDEWARGPHWLIPGHEEWGTEVEEGDNVVGKLVTLSKYVKLNK